MTPYGLKTLFHQYNGKVATVSIQSLSDVISANLLKKMSSVVWDSYYRCRPELITSLAALHDPHQIERSITQILSDDIFCNFPIEAPFSFQQNRDEFASLHSPKAQPPQYDMAFYLKSDTKVSWPLEAKLLDSPKNLSEYIKDINESLLTGKYAPYSDSAAMVGYLRKPDALTCKTEIESKLKVVLEKAANIHAHWTSDHIRPLPVDNSITQDFRCHHFIFELY